MRLVLAIGLTCVALGGSAGCGHEPVPPNTPGLNVAVSREASGLRIANQTSRPIAFAVFEGEYAARMQFAPCIDLSPACVRLASGESTVVPYEQVGGYRSGARTAIVYWWHVVPVAGGYRADEIRSEIVLL